MLNYNTIIYKNRSLKLTVDYALNVRGDVGKHLFMINYYT